MFTRQKKIEGLKSKESINVIITVSLSTIDLDDECIDDESRFFIYDEIEEIMDEIDLDYVLSHEQKIMIDNELNKKRNGCGNFTFKNYKFDFVWEFKK